VTLLNVAIVRTRAVQGGREEPAEDLARAFAANRNRGFAGWIAQYIAEILLRREGEDFAEAEKWARRALELNREGGMRLLLGRDYLLLAGMEKRRRNVEAAKGHLQQAMEVFQDCGTAGYLQKAKEEWIRLASLSLDK
jgi:tetratricopeptide (TPR) repeat protein